MPWVAQAAPDATPDIDTLIGSLKKAAPTTVAFSEVRFSRLLKQPAIVAGQLGYLGVEQLDRTVEQPYREHTEIRSDSVRVTREGEPDRSFALKRAPELRAMLLTFSAMLSGDRMGIEQNFRLQATGDSEQWSLELVPLDTRLQRRLEKVIIVGTNASPHCFATYTRDGGVSMILLGPLAAIAVSPMTTQDALWQRCRSGH